MAVLALEKGSWRPQNMKNWAKLLSCANEHIFDFILHKWYLETSKAVVSGMFFSTGGLPDYLLHNKCTSYGAFLLCKDHFQYSSSLLVSVHCIMYFVISTAIIHFCQHTLSLIIAGERWEDNKKLPDFSMVESKSFSHSYFAPGTGTSSTEGRRGVGGGGGKHIAIQMGVGSGPSKHLEPEGKWDDLIHMQVLCC